MLQNVRLYFGDHNNGTPSLLPQFPQFPQNVMEAKKGSTFLGDLRTTNNICAVI
jgi:hypothetical protein